MKSTKGGYTSVDSYIESFPVPVQKILQALRTTILDAAPDAEEVISYQMPAFKLKGNLVYFAAWKKHIGFYPASSGAFEAFKDELAQFKGTSGSVHFPLDKPLPLQLIRDIVEFRVIEDLKHAEEKSKKRK